MAKIQPLPAASPSAEWHHGDGGGGGVQGKQAVYTVWMKSLVFNGHGCTVYGSDGRVAFRVDNYGCRGSRDVFFMDTAGTTLIGIQTKSFGMMKRWEASRHHGGEKETTTATATTPWFRVQRGRGPGGAMATVTLHGGVGMAYRIDGTGSAAAEVARKQTASGVVLGEDVLTLTVGPGADHLLVLGLVVVCGLISRAM
uniref:Protein LURP-one-related 11 n=1 Tax=Oryza barthii TaxID=65489 RepID=A0A0D3EY93_9ORYZ